jgi:hypothetical protein
MQIKRLILKKVKQKRKNNKINNYNKCFLVVLKVNKKDVNKKKGKK